MQRTHSDNTSVNARSFSRYEPTPKSPTKSRSRSNTAGSDTVRRLETAVRSPLVEEEELPKSHSDLFETQEDDEHNAEEGEPEPATPSESYNELPIEIQSLMDRFLESLTAKVHPTPLSVDRLSELFQDFYEHTRTQIGTHIATLASRISREQSPNPSISSGGSFGSRGPGRKGSKPIEQGTPLENEGPEQQMLTASEITDKRRVRRQLELKRFALEEAVERGVCEKIYPRLWRHRSTDDEERDEKLRSRAAALNVVGVSLTELLSTALSQDTGDTQDVLQEPTEQDPAENAQMHEARSSLAAMNSERSPLGKLNHLTATHKNIVEALQQMFPSTSSADEVLPALIYTIITTPPEENCIISNFNYIQRFRAAYKIDGEVAYCLTNLEAAISFLETVDLSSIRPSELAVGPGKTSSTASSPRTDSPNPMYRALPNSINTKENDNKSLGKDLSSPGSPRRSRRFSNLVQIGAHPIDAASGAMLHSADAAFDTIHNALDGSFKFLFGRLKERRATTSPGGKADVIVPKTLEDARKLVNPELVVEDDASVSESATADLEGNVRAENGQISQDPRVSDLISARRNTRSGSIESNKSGQSFRKVAFTQNQSTLDEVAKSKEEPSKVNISSPPAFGAVESMRNLGNTLNPLRNFSGIGMMRGFGNKSPATTPIASPSIANTHVGSPLSSASHPDDPLANSLVSARKGQDVMDLSSMSPPIKRFADLREPRELTFFDVELLLRDYQRLAGAIKAAGGPDAV